MSPPCLFKKKNSQMLLNQAEETSNPPSGMGLSAWSLYVLSVWVLWHDTVPYRWMPKKSPG